MPGKPLQDRIDAKKLKLAQDRARLGLMEGRARSEQRKRDDRRKILIGAAVISEIERDPNLRLRIRQLLDVFIVRPIDRAVLLDLLPEAPHPPAANPDGLRRAVSEVSTPAVAVGQMQNILAELHALTDTATDQSDALSAGPEARAKANG